MPKLNLPSTFLTRLEGILGSAMPDFEAAHELPPPVSLRLNPAKPRPKGIAELTEAPIPWAIQGYYLTSRPSFTLDPLFHGGAYYVQEASSMLLEQALRPVLPHARRVLDLCAAPGGKSTHILSLLAEDALLVSNEVIRNRTTLLSENLIKWGAPNRVITQLDPEAFARVPGYFDVIVADVPCSGEGLFRKDPQAIQEWSPEHTELCVRRQRRILQEVWPALKPGGFLLYSTCTYNPAENELNLAWFAEQTGAQSLPFSIPPGTGVWEGENQGIHFKQCFPHQVKGEGFFLALLQKPGNADPTNGAKSTLTSAGKEPLSLLQEYVPQARKDDIFEHQGYRWFPGNLHPDLEAFRRKLPVIQAGVALGEIKHGRVIPDHELAVSTLMAGEFSRVLDVGLPEALAYLRCESFFQPATEKGYHLIRYQQLSLGWANHLGTRINNGYPSAWRIRMSGSGENQGE